MLRPDEYVSYRIASPLTSHRELVSCSVFGCEAWKYGWSSRFELTDTLRIEYVRNSSGRQFREIREETTIRFDFPPGQKCFNWQSHYVQIRPESYSVLSGDSRSGHREVLRRHTRPVDWVEDLALHQDRVKTVLERG
jgi:hypothetical protein